MNSRTSTVAWSVLLVAAALPRWGMATSAAAEAGSETAASAAAAADSADTGHGWHQLIMEGDRDLRLRRAIADGHGGMWVLFARQEKGRALQNGGLHLMHVDSGGQRGDAVAVVLPAELDHRRACSGVAMALGANGQPAVLCNTNVGIALIEPALIPEARTRVRSFSTDAWPFGLQAAGYGRFHVATNEAVLLWPPEGDPAPDLAAGENQVFIAATNVPGGLALLEATVGQSGPVALRAGRLNAARPTLDGFRAVGDGGQVSTMLTRVAASDAWLAVLAPLDRGPPSRWHNAVFDADMNLAHAGPVTLPFEITLTMPLALHVLPRGDQVLAGARDGALWLARIDTEGKLHEHETPAHLLPAEGQLRRMIDMQWVASADSSRPLLVSTAIVFGEEKDGADYGLWLAEIDWSADGAPAP
jgi:hypothetical protein